MHTHTRKRERERGVGGTHTHTHEHIRSTRVGLEQTPVIASSGFGQGKHITGGENVSCPRGRMEQTPVVSKGLEHINTSHNTSHTQVSHRDASGLLGSRQVLGRSRCSRQNVTEAATAERKRWRRRVDRPPPERPPPSPVRTTGAEGNKMDTYIDTLANYPINHHTPDGLGQAAVDLAAAAAVRSPGAVSHGSGW